MNQFSIGTLLLVTTLASMCLGLCVAIPRLGIPLSVLSAAALARTIWVGRVHLGQGLAFELPEKVGSFVISLGVILGAIFAAFAAFLMVLGLGSIVAGVLFNFGPPRADHIGFRMLAVMFGITLLTVPVTVAIRFLWFTRPS